jgi:hypothetical protein
MFKRILNLLGIEVVGRLLQMQVVRSDSMQSLGTRKSQFALLCRTRTIRKPKRAKTDPYR